MAPHPTAPDNSTQDWGPAVHRLCAHLGIDVPAPMTPAERADWERRQDEADAQVLRLSRPGAAAA